MWYLGVTFFGRGDFFLASDGVGNPRGGRWGVSLFRFKTSTGIEMKKKGTVLGIERGPRKGGGWMCRDSIGRPHVCIRFHRTHVYGERGGHGYEYIQS